MDKHIPVLLREAVEALNVKPDGVYADFTLGRAGHSLEIARRLTTGKLFCIDRDREAIDAARVTLADYADRVTLIKCDFRDAAEHIRSETSAPLDGILMDLGLSSPQIDNATRGVSYMSDAPLDMRMDTEQALTAHDIVNDYDADELRRIISEYGEEHYAGRIAQRIVSERPINTTLELVNVIKKAMPAKALREKGHPAMRTFQAIRIAVNDELGALAEALGKAEHLLAPDGRLCVITFHSLEDRIVKEFIHSKEKGCTCPSDFPVCVCGFKPTMMKTGKPILPSSEELEHNPRAHSAKLRVAVKL